MSAFFAIKKKSKEIKRNSLKAIKNNYYLLYLICNQKKSNENR